MGKVILALAGMIALSCLVMYAVFLRAPVIEGDIAARARLSLEGAGIGNVDVKADGRGLLLSGSDEIKDKSLEIVSAVNGVASAKWHKDSGQHANADAGLVNSATSAGWTTSLAVEEGQLKITGDRSVQDEVNNAVVARLGESYGEAHVTVASSGEKELPENWADMVSVASLALSKMHSGSAEITDNRLSIRGDVTHERGAAEIKAMLEEQTPLGVIWNTELAALTAEELALAQRMSPRECHESVADHMKGKTLQFKKYKTSLQDSAFVIIDGVATILKRCPSASVQIGGYTDSRGKTKLNLQLSRQRAEAVLTYLVGEGIDALRLEAKGFGSKSPVASNKTAKGREANRRIEFRVMGEE